MLRTSASVCNVLGTISAIKMLAFDAFSIDIEIKPLMLINRQKFLYHSHYAQ